MIEVNYFYRTKNRSKHKYYHYNLKFKKDIEKERIIMTQKEEDL